MNGIGGVAVATITPFGPGGREIDFTFIQRHLAMLEREGAHGIVPVGTNGEFPSLTLDEKKRVLEVATAFSGEMFVIAGCGSSSLPEAVELVAFAEASGADAALVVPPFYFRDAGEEGVIEFYRRILTETSLPVLLYNIPVYSGIAITDRIIDALLEHGNLIGVKDTGGDPARTGELVRRYPQLKIFGGSDSLVGEAVAEGAAGVISGAANVFPGLLRDVWEARAAGGDPTATGERVRALREVIKDHPWVAATKTALELRGFPGSYVRPPLTDLDDGQKAELRRRLAELGLTGSVIPKERSD